MKTYNYDYLRGSACNKSSLQFSFIISPVNAAQSLPSATFLSASVNPESCASKNASTLKKKRGSHEFDSS